MKKKLFLVASVLFSGLLASCDYLDSFKSSGDVEYIPFQSSENANWGLISTDGEVLLEEEFKHKPTAAVNGLFFVKDKNGEYEIWTAEKKTKTIGERYLSICPFTEDVTVAVQKNQHISIIDKKGKQVASLDKANGKNIKTAQAFSEGLAIIETEDGYGYVDTKGKVVVEPKYAVAMPCSDGKLITITKREYEKNGIEGLYTILDKKGKELFTIKGSKYRISSGYKHGLLSVCAVAGDDLKCGFLDEKGEETLKPSSKISIITDWSEKDFIFYDGEGYGLKSMEGETIIRPKYNQLQYAGNDLLWACKSGDDDNYILIDKKGTEITKDGYSTVMSFMGSCALVRVSAKEWGLINDSGEELKLKTDIYDVSIETGPLFVTSDFMDLDAIVKALHITADGLGGLNVNLNPQQMIKPYSEYSGTDMDRIDPNTYWLTDRLEYEKQVEEVSVEFMAVYQGALSNNSGGYWYDSNYEWSSEKPLYIEAKVSGKRLRGKTQNMFRQILANVKSLGNVYKENRGAAIVAVRGGCFIVINHGAYVTARRENGESYKNYDISKYQNVEENTVIDATLEEDGIGTPPDDYSDEDYNEEYYEEPADVYEEEDY